MKKYLILFLINLFMFNTAYSTQCNADEIPKVIKPMENWDIIATNTATIQMAPVFSGKDLTYSFSAHHKKQNIVTIDNKKGTLRIDAEKQDKFDVIVKAKNTCGEASNKFNVIIDEEE